MGAVGTSSMNSLNPLITPHRSHNLTRIIQHKITLQHLLHDINMVAILKHQHSPRAPNPMYPHSLVTPLTWTLASSCHSTAPPVPPTWTATLVPRTPSSSSLNSLQPCPSWPSSPNDPQPCPQSAASCAIASVLSCALSSSSHRPQLRHRSPPDIALSIFTGDGYVPTRLCDSIAEPAQDQLNHLLVLGRTIFVDSTRRF